MIIKVSVPGRFQFKAVPSFKTMFLQKQGEIHYIGDIGFSLCIYG